TLTSCPNFGEHFRLTPDPLGGDISNPQSLNRYAYALNNPTTLTDPTGLSGVKIYMAAPVDWGDEFDYVFPSGVDNEGDFYTGIDPNGLAVVESNFGAFHGSGFGAFNKLIPTGVFDTPSNLYPSAPPQISCAGKGRGLSGNTALIGKQGGIPGQTVQLGTAAVIPQQFGVPTGAALAPYASNIWGTIGKAPFSAVTDVIGGKSPIPGVPVRTALPQLFPGQLILEIPGAKDQGANAPLNIFVPQTLGCPAGTSLAGGG
ncbi:MAG: hypothetical protein ACRD2G_18285, partial [Terriglobia bacterium]